MSVCTQLEKCKGIKSIASTSESKTTGLYIETYTNVKTFETSRSLIFYRYKDAAGVKHKLLLNHCPICAANQEKFIEDWKEKE